MFLNNPYLIALLFFQLLLFISFVVGRVSKFIGLILFLIYVGGLMILVRYCVLLLPSVKLGLPLFILPFFFCIGGLLVPSNAFCFGLSLSFSVVFLIAIILYLVMLCVVDVVDYSRGSLKYVKSSELSYFFVFSFIRYLLLWCIELSGCARQGEGQAFRVWTRSLSRVSPLQIEILSCRCDFFSLRC